jgi:hypothetical protein
LHAPAIGRAVSETLVFAIMHREKANKVFGKHYPYDCSQLSKQVIFHRNQVALRPGVFVVNYVELFLHLSLTISTMTSTSTTRLLKLMKLGELLYTCSQRFHAPTSRDDKAFQKGDIAQPFRQNQCQRLKGNEVPHAFPARLSVQLLQ